MRKYLIISFLAILSVCNVYADKSNLIPFGGDIIGLEFDEVKEKYPKIRTVFEEKNGNGKIDSCIVYLEISGNPFWDSAIIKVSDGTVSTCSFVKTKNFDEARKNVPNIVRLMVKEFGKVFLKKINNVLTKKGNADGPLLVWQREDKIFAFTSSPLESDYGTDDIFCCQLTILSKGAELSKEFKILERSENKKNKIFEQIDRIVESMDNN